MKDEGEESLRSMAATSFLNSSKPSGKKPHCNVYAVCLHAAWDLSTRCRQSLLCSPRAVCRVRREKGTVCSSEGEGKSQGTERGMDNLGHRKQ
jgi:hypothetical protein